MHALVPGRTQTAVYFGGAPPDTGFFFQGMCCCTARTCSAARAGGSLILLWASAGQSPSAGSMQLLPKRPVLEKSNGAAAGVFTPSMFHYQQALANMQLQQPAFIPTGECYSCGDSALTSPSFRPSGSPFTDA